MSTSPPPNEDDGPDPDPVEAELIAYLDSELDPAAARKVEAKLSADPKLRARAEALKRSFDLLDFLPKPEPSQTFTSRTLDKLVPAAARTSATAATAVLPNTTPVPRTAPALVPTPLPITPAAENAPSSGGRSEPAVAAPQTRRSWVWAAGIAAAAGAALGMGYVGTGVVRSSLYPAPPPPKVTAAPVVPLPLADLRVVENLALYVAVDNLDFLDRLAGPDLFGPDVVPHEGMTPSYPVEVEKPVGKQLDQLVKVFRELPPDRQEKMRHLDRHLHELEPARRAKSVRVMETYAAWLYRLPDANRKTVLAAPTAEKRLGVIREVRHSQWAESLPAELRKQLKTQPAVQADLIAQWRAKEEALREGWLTARTQWEIARSGRIPWPFQDERMKKEVLEFATAAYHPADPKRCRLIPADRDRLVEALKEAQETGDKAHWFPLGKVVYDFSKKPQYDLLPEPGNGKLVIDFPDLADWEAAKKHFSQPVPRSKLNAHVGKWPDFALEVSAEMSRAKFGGIASSSLLGPCRPADFKDDVRRYIPELQRKLTSAEAKALKELEGQWPDYPKELIRLARARDMSVPGVMPPGPPSMWEKTYNLVPRPAAPLPKPGG